MEAARMICRSILIVEDDKAIRESLAVLLVYEGYQVFSACNGQDGLDLLKKIPSPCLVLLDFMMPIMNGQEFIEAKMHDDAIASIPVIVVSAYEDRATKLKSSGFVKKPIDFESLLRFVKQYCDPAEQATLSRDV